MSDAAPASHTPAVNIRVPRQLWDAYGRCTARINGGRDRTEDLTRHMVRTIELIGSEQDRHDLADALEELEARRSRKGGRPRKPAEGQAPAALELPLIDERAAADELDGEPGIDAWIAHLKCGHAFGAQSRLVIGSYVTCTHPRCQGQKRVMSVDEPAGVVGLDHAPGIVVIGCGFRKQDHAAPARDLYTGVYFRSCLDAATAAAPARRVFILSARYGLLPLDETIEPYDLNIGEPGAVTAADLAAQAEALGISGQPVTALCSARYATLVGQVWEDVTTPLAGLGVGYQRAVLGAMRDARTLLPALPPSLAYAADFREDD